jgi:hypothetical protein
LLSKEVSEPWLKITAQKETVNHLSNFCERRVCEQFYSLTTSLKRRIGMGAVVVVKRQGRKPSQNQRVSSTDKGSALGNMRPEV